MQQSIKRSILHREGIRNETMPIQSRHSMRKKKMLLVMPTQKKTRLKRNKIPNTNMHIRRQMQIQRRTEKTETASMQILRQRNKTTPILLKPAYRIENMAIKTQANNRNLT